MIVPDANLLLYTYDAVSPFHSKSRNWWLSCLAGADPVGLCPAVIFAFIRIGTSPRAFSKPLTAGEATEHVESWLKQPAVQLLEVDAVDIRRTLELLRKSGAAGNLTTDAQIAAASLRYGATVHTADSDFGRFPEVRWLNPLFE